MSRKIAHIYIEVDKLSTTSNEKICEYVKNIQSNLRSKHVLNKHMRTMYSELYNEILNRTKFLNKFIETNKSKTISIIERIYCLEHNLIDRPKCKMCDNYVKWTEKTNSYTTYCSNICVISDKDIYEKAKQTMIERYGVDSYTKTDEYKDRVKQTNLEKYGCEYTSQNEDIKEKIKQTMIERYGVENASQCEYIKNKIRNTNLKKYGYVSNLSNPLVRDKINKTNIIKYGNKVPILSEQVRSSMLKNNIKKYGTDNIATFISYNLLTQNEYDSPNFTIEEYSNRTDDYELLSFKCKKCGNIFETRHYDGFHKKCPICYPTDKISNQEREFLGLIKSIYNEEIIQNDRIIINPYELDIYLPKLNIAFEYNGEFWHKEGLNKPIGYHLMKTNLCKDKGINLYHIWERHWINRKDDMIQFVKSTIDV